MPWSPLLKILVEENLYQLVLVSFYQIKAPQFYTDLDLKKHC